MIDAAASATYDLKMLLILISSFTSLSAFCFLSVPVPGSDDCIDIT